MKRYSVYVIEHPNDGVVYVGCTNDFRRRCREHKSRRPEFHGCFMTEVARCGWRIDAESREAELIRELQPRFNRVVPSGQPSELARRDAVIDLFECLFGDAA